MSKKINDEIIKAYNNTVTREIMKIEKKNIDKNSLNSYHDFNYGEKLQMRFNDILFKDIKLDATSSRLFLLLLEKFTQQVKKNETDLNVLEKDGTIIISINEYMETFNMKDRKSAKKQIKSIIDTFSKMQISYKELKLSTKCRNKQGKEYYKNNIDNCYGFINVFDKCFTDVFKNKTHIVCTFSNTIAKCLSLSNIMFLPKNIYKLDLNKYILSQKIITELYYLISQHNSHDKINLYNFVKNMYSFSDDNGNIDRHIKQRIITPLIKNIDYLVSVGMINKYSFVKKEKSKYVKINLLSTKEITLEDLKNIYFKFDVDDVKK